MRYISILLIILFSFPILTSDALAGALRFPEQGQPSMGTASVGQAALADNASTAYFNPAGMTRLKRPEVLLGGQLGFVNMEFNSAGGMQARGSDGGQIGGFAPGGGLYAVYNFASGIYVGLAVNAPSAAIETYHENWKGRYEIQKLFFIDMNINPVMAVRLTDWFSVGGGVAINYAIFKQRMALFNGPVRGDGYIELDLDDWDVGYNLGALLEPWDGTRVGFAYRSGVKLDLTGKIDPQGMGPLWTRAGLQRALAKTELVIPAMIIASLYQDITDKFAVLFDVGWEDWSKMKKTLITTSNGSAVTLGRDWIDTWRIGVGGQYRVADPLLVKAGFSIDTTPSNYRNRLPDMPMDRQLRYAAGLEYDVCPDVTLCLNYEFIDLGPGKIQRTTPNGLVFSGDYDQYINYVGFSLIWRFGEEPGKSKEKDLDAK